MGLLYFNTHFKSTSFDGGYVFVSHVHLECWGNGVLENGEMEQELSARKCLHTHAEILSGPRSLRLFVIINNSLIKFNFLVNYEKTVNHIYGML